MTENHYNLMVSWQLTQKVLERVKRQLGDGQVLIESLMEEAKARKTGGWQRRRVLEDVMKRRRYEMCAHECNYCFAQVVHHQVLKLPKPKTFELCFH